MQPILTLGLMSGTSRDGIDAALLLTDGETHIEPKGHLTIPYTPEFQSQIAAACARAATLKHPAPDPLIDQLSTDLAELHATAVHRLLAATGTPPEAVALIGFHGHTPTNRTKNGPGKPATPPASPRSQAAPSSTISEAQT